METETRPATNGNHAAAPSFHVHATGLGEAGAITISIPADAARILLDVCNLPGVAEHLQTSQAKLQVGYAQQALESALSILAAEPTEEAPTDDAGPDDAAEH